MYAATQSSIDPSLAALLQTAQMVTPDNTPTVAAQVAEAAKQKMAPQGITQGMPQAQQDFQAAMPSVMRNMQQQQMQQMLQQAMQRKPAGIEGLPAPNMQAMAEGGVVGFAGDEFGSYVSEDVALDALRVAEAKRRREDEERRRQLEFLESAGAPQAAQYREPVRAAQPAAQPVVQQPSPPVPQSRPQPRPQPRPQVAPQTTQSAPTGIAAALPAQPTLEGAMRQAEKALPGSATEQNRAALEELQRMRRERPAAGIGALAALQEEARVMAELKAKEDASAQERGIMSWLAGRGGRGSSAQSYLSYQQGEQQRQKLFAQENTIRAAKIDAINDANEARKVGDQEKYVEALGKLSELDRADRQIKAQLASNTLQAQASMRGQDMQALEGDLNRAQNERLERIRQSAANKPGQSERIFAEYMRLKGIDPKAAEQYLSTMDQIMSLGKGTEDRNNLARQKLLESDSNYKMARMMYVNEKDPTKKAEFLRQMREIERLHGIEGESAPAQVPPGVTVKRVGP